MGLLKRNGWYYYYKRVPEHVQEFDTRRFIRISLKTKDKLEAQKRAVIYEDEHIKFWQSLIQKGEKADVAKFKRASAIAKAHGFAFKDSKQIAKSSDIFEITQRLETAYLHKSNPQVKEALLGETDYPQILLSDCFEQYEKLCADRLTNKSEHQIRKFTVARKRSLDDFIKTIGNKAISDIKRKDILKFKEWLLTQITNGLNADTANKKMRQAKDIMRTVANANEIEFDEDYLFAKTRFKLNHVSRPPFEEKFVQNTLLPKLDGLNDDARLLVYAMADTGAREAELVGLDENDIFLNEEIPYIWIRAKDKRSLKTAHSERQIPLVGTSLHAFQQRPKGFSRYKEADSISSLINKYFSNNNLRPTDKHSLYSLRHTFKDRLRDIGAPEEVIDQLMGHKIDKPRYGRGHILKTTQEWLLKIAFTPPK